jgi:hypothetical protein
MIPLSVAEARHHFTFPFPDSAINVHFASYREWIAAKDFIRFEAPAADCIAAAEQLIKDHNAKHPDRTIPALSALEVVKHVVEPEPLSVPWFTPQTIRKGLVGGQSGSHQPLIWVDTERGVFYYQYRD